MKILNTSWGGRGEHGLLEVFMKVDENKLILSLCDRCYDDWGRVPQLTNEITGSKSYDVDMKNLTQKYLYECVIDLVEKEYQLTVYRIKEEDICYPA